MTTMREKLAGLVAEELDAFEHTDFEAMTIDELDDWILDHRAINTDERFRPVALKVAAARNRSNRKVAEWHVEEARRQISRVAADEGLPERRVAQQVI